MNRSSEAGVVIAATVVGGAIGIMVDGVLGAVSGIAFGAGWGGLATLALERRRHALEVDKIDDAVWAAMIEPPLDDDPAWHTRQHPRAHVHYEYPPTFATGSLLFRPTF